MLIAITRYLVTLEKLDEYVAEHRKFLDSLYSKKLLIASGPQKPRSGGVIIANIKDRKTFFDIFVDDPFLKYDLAEYQVYEFDPIKHAPEIASLVG